MKILNVYTNYNIDHTVVTCQQSLYTTVGGTWLETAIMEAELMTYDWQTCHRILCEIKQKVTILNPRGHETSFSN